MTWKPSKQTLRLISQFRSAANGTQFDPGKQSRLAMMQLAATAGSLISKRGVEQLGREIAEAETIDEVPWFAIAIYSAGLAKQAEPKRGRKADDAKIAYRQEQWEAYWEANQSKQRRDRLSKNQFMQTFHGVSAEEHEKQRRRLQERGTF